MLKKRNAQGISIQVIIIAAIALVVLVVLIAIFTGKFGIFSSGINKILSENVPWLASTGEEEDGTESNSGAEPNTRTEISCSTCLPSLLRCQARCEDSTSEDKCRTDCVPAFSLCERTCSE